ncbi:MAG: hypothetical protein K8E66_12240, partial [Phycisphaerales bacterium]|nr:hypothetical protein [Phycisphaerales bacterium]
DADESHAHGSEMQEPEGHDHGEPRPLGPIEIAGTTLIVTLSGHVEPNAEIHIEIEHAAGPKPVAVRFWIGGESGVSSVKCKADGQDNHYHGHAEAPGEIDEECGVWIEIETASGERVAGRAPLD